MKGHVQRRSAHASERHAAGNDYTGKRLREGRELLSERVTKVKIDLSFTHGFSRVMAIEPSCLNRFNGFLLRCTC